METKHPERVRRFIIDDEDFEKLVDDYDIDKTCLAEIGFDVDVMETKKHTKETKSKRFRGAGW